jgi:serine/threonine-protein kinase PknK
VRLARTSRTRTTLLAGLIVVAAVVGITGWVVRYQPFGPPGPLGSPVPSGDPAAQGWRLEDGAPFARLEMAAAVLHDRLWLAGGLNRDGSAIAEVSALDPIAGTWTDGPSLPEPVDHAALASDGKRLYLVGGFRGASRAASRDVLILDPERNEWTTGPMLPEPRAAGALAWDGRRLVYGGGVGLDGDRAEVFVMESGTWRQIARLAQPRQHLAAASDSHGRTWFLGGRQGGADHNLGDVDLLVAERTLPLTPLTPRGGVAAFHAGSVGACLTGGETPVFALTIVECVDAQGRVTALPGMTQRRHGHGAGVIRGRVYVVLGGETPGLSVSHTVESLAIPH